MAIDRDDVGEEYPKKKESQQLFLDFFKVPKDSPRRKQEGVYHAELFGPVGKRVAELLLRRRGLGQCKQVSGDTQNWPPDDMKNWPPSD